MTTRTQKAQRVTWIGFCANLALSTLKLIAGILGNSAAMVADAVHSISDFITDIIVLAFVQVSDKGTDEDHRYGHGKFETFATLLVSVALLIVGIGIFVNGLKNIIHSLSGNILEQPSYIALIAAVVSIITKEWLYRYTVKVGKAINNQAVVANAWHHRSDAFSSIGTMVGIGGAIFFSEKWRILDPLAGVIVSFFIMKVAIELAIPSIKELLETSLPKELEKEILETIHKTAGIKYTHHFKTRKIGNNIAVDIHVKLDENLTFTESHAKTIDIEKNLKKKYGENTQISIHAEPYQE